jgi:ubiquinone/menaquinone biosynthesis C-methylase UbiE
MTSPECMSNSDRATDYDTVADGYDCRYALHAYAGMERQLARFVDGARPAGVLEIGCGTGHWLALLAAGAPRIAGIDPSARMLARAKAAAPSAVVIRAAAERLPWRDAAFDRVICINAAHHFGDRRRAIAESGRVLRPGGGVLIAGREPPSDEERWWVYEYFEETRAIDRARYATAEALRREMTEAGLVRCETFEMDRIDAAIPAAGALASGVVDRRYTSQLSALSDESFARGVERIRAAAAAARARSEELMLHAHIRYEATVGWRPGPPGVIP